MAINFENGDLVVVKQAYVDNYLQNLASTEIVPGILELVGLLAHEPATVQATGTVTAFVQNATLDLTAQTRYYIRVVPTNTKSPLYNDGDGATLYFLSESQLNDTFELATAYLADKLFVRAFNNSGSTISKGKIVRFTAYDTVNLAPNIALASAEASNTSTVLGISEQDIPNNSFGSILVEGDYQGLDTSGFTVNSIVYLSDTAGNISASQGTVSSLVGRVHTVNATTGAISVRGEMPFGAGGGGGGGGSTGIQGVTGLSSGPIGATGIQGNTGLMGGGATGIQGVTGLQGIQGNTGLMGGGATGIRGLTGLAGNNGSQGATGVQGNTGVAITGATGIAGVTGIRGLDGSTGIGFLGATGVQGVTGIGSGSGAGTITTLATVTNIDPVAGTTEIFLYNVPAATSAVISFVVLRCTAANGVTEVPTMGVGFNATGADNVFAPVALTGVTGANDLWTFASTAKAVVGTAGATLLLGIDTATTGSTHLFSADIMGYTF